jgi:hypothetical protein
MKRLINSKKAVSAKIFYWLFILSILVPIMVFSLSKVINTYYTQSTKTGNIENILIEDRIMNILAFNDPNTGRLYPGIIYLPNFNETFITHLLKTKRSFGLKLSLEGQQIIYFNQEFYEIALPLKDTNKYEETKKQRYVLIKNKEGDTFPSLMEISIMHYREYE